MAGALIASLLASALAVPAPPSLDISKPYKVDGAWSFFVNDKMCMAGIIRPADNAVLIMGFDATKKIFTVSFTEKSATRLAEDGHMMGIRFHRTSGALDEGWEDVWFTALEWDGDSIIWVSQPMDETAMHDFNDFTTLVFIDHGRSAGTFRSKNNQAAVRELSRCAREQRNKN